MLRSLAKQLARSPFLEKGKRLFEQNSRKWDMPLTRLEKLLSGTYVILDDYSKGIFPPRFEDQAKAYEAEVNYRATLPGQNLEQLRRAELQKPFWWGAIDRYLAD